MSVGVILRDISSLFMSQIVASAEPVLRAAGYSMLLMNSGGDPDLDVEHIQFFQARRVDGMILQLANDRRRKTFDWLARSVAPVVLVDREAPARIRASSVLTDHQAGMRDAVESLIDLGHRRIALVTGAPDVRPSRERLAGLEATMRGRGLGSPIVVPGQLTDAHGETATEQLLSMPDPPTAIVVGSNQLLAGALRTFCSRGIVPGDQVSLVSCDDSPLSELYRPPISVIDRDSREMGRLAAELILDRMVSAGDPRTEVMGTKYIARPSCAPPSTKVRAHAAAGRG